MSLENYLQSRKRPEEQKCGSSVEPLGIIDIMKVMEKISELEKNETAEKSLVKKQQSIEEKKQDLKDILAKTYEAEEIEVNPRNIESAVNEYFSNNQTEGKNNNSYFSVFKEIGRKFLKGAYKTGEFIASPLFIPTYHRQKRFDISFINDGVVEPIGGLLYISWLHGSLAYVIFSLINHYFIASNDSSFDRNELYIVTSMIVTNTLSVAYEWFRYGKKKLEDKV